MLHGLDICVHMNRNSLRHQVSPLSLPGPSDLTAIGTTPPKTWPRRGLFSHHFSLPFLTQLRSPKASQDDPFWRPKTTQDRPKTGLETIFVKNVDVHETICFLVVFGPSRPQDRAKIAPRSPQDGLKIVLRHGRFSRRFCDRF